MDAIRNKQLSELRRQIVDYFDMDELRLVSFELGVKWDDLSGEKVSTKAHSCVLFADRTGKIDDLITILSRERLNVTWTKVSPRKDFPVNVSSSSENDSIRTSVWNALYRSLWTKKTFLNSHKGNPPLIHKFSVALWADYFNKPIDARPEEPNLILKEIRHYYFSCADDEFYVFLEFILNFWNELRHYKPEIINHAVNVVLKREKTGMQYICQIAG